MQLTQEQKDIIDASFALKCGEILKINAIAGSGKTSTLLQIANSHPTSKFLYLAFNRNIVEESKKKFPKNVEAKTLHSLAYNAIIKPKGFKIENRFHPYFLKSFVQYKDYAQLGEIYKAINKYLDSAQTTPPQEIASIVENLFDLMQSAQIPYFHNFYLKEFQLLKDKNIPYDFILLDEAQDTNAVTLDIFLNNSCKKILVGDTHQNIYNFINSVNALEIVKTQHSFNLSYSFRTPQDILDKASFFLKRFAHSKISMKSLSTAKNVQTRCIITRTNARIIELIAKDFKENARKLNVLKPLDSVFGISIAVLLHRNNEHEKIESSYRYLLDFESLQEIGEYAKNAFDLELYFAVNLVHKFGNDIFKYRSYANFLQNNKSATFDVMTAHTAKGLEWDEIILEDDFTDLNEYVTNFRATSHDKAAWSKFYAYVKEETNLYYVALTRAKVACIDNTPNAQLYGTDMGKSG